MLITEKDVGRAVKLRSGNVSVINNFDPDNRYPVLVSAFGSYSAEGYFYDPTHISDCDIVEFVDESVTAEQYFAEAIENNSDEDFEDNGQFIQKVPSAESNAKRFLNMLKAQGIYELVVVTDIGEVRCKLNVEKQSEG